MCKHVAAVLYGVGVRLDRQPDLLFTLRGVQPDALVGAGAALGAAVSSGAAGPVLAAEDLGAIFGVTIDDGAPASPPGGARESAAWHPEDVAVWTLGELVQHGQRSLAEVVAFAMGQVHAPSKRAR